MERPLNRAPNVLTQYQAEEVLNKIHRRAKKKFLKTRPCLVVKAVPMFYSIDEGCYVATTEPRNFALESAGDMPFEDVTKLTKKMLSVPSLITHSVGLTLNHESSQNVWLFELTAARKKDVVAVADMDTVCDFVSAEEIRNILSD